MTMNVKQAAVLVGINASFGASLVLGLGTMAHASPMGETVELRKPVVQVSEMDTMSDGSVFVTDADGSSHHRMLDQGQWRDVTESDTEWSCVDDGNRVCGPGNIEGKPAACYDEGGVIVAVWPCQSVVNADGSQNVDWDDDVALAAYQVKRGPKH